MKTERSISKPCTAASALAVEFDSASPEQMCSVLGIDPGALTPFAIINDSQGLVTLVIDADLMGAAQLNFHPMVQTESVGLNPADLRAFIESCGRIPHVFNLAADRG